MPPSRPPRPPSSKAVRAPSTKELFHKRGTDLIRKVSDKDRYAIFVQPVNVDEVEGYSDLIARPMDLSTAQENLDNGLYRTPAELRADLDLIWSNCCTFNADNSIYFKEAVRLRALAARYYDDLVRLLIRDGVADALGLSNQPQQHRLPSTRARPPSLSDPHSTPSSPQLLSSPRKGAGSSRRRPRPSRARAALDSARAEVKAAEEHLAAVEYAAGLSSIPPRNASTTTQQQQKSQESLQPEKEIQQQPNLNSNDTSRPQLPRCKLSLSAARDLRARAASHPPVWRSVGRWHAGVTRRAPFLSTARALEAPAANAYAQWVTRSAPVARRLLATVLDAGTVHRADLEALSSEKITTSAATSTTCAATKTSKLVQPSSEATASTPKRSGNSSPRKKSMVNGVLVTANTTGVLGRKRAREDPTSQLLYEVLGKERMQKMSKRNDKLPVVRTDGLPSKSAVSRLNALLRQKGVDTTFVSELAAHEVNEGKKSGESNGVSCNAAGGLPIQNGEDVALKTYNKQMGALLNANYETMMNALRLRALRECVPEAIREDVEDRERDCVESVARGLGVAVNSVAPRLVVHPADASESLVAFVGVTPSGDAAGAGGTSA